MLAMLAATLEDERERAAFTALYRQHQPALCRAAHHMLPAPQDAEGALQNTWLQVVRHFEKVSQISCHKMGPWLVCILKNEVRQLVRGRTLLLQLAQKEGYTP